MDRRRWRRHPAVCNRARIEWWDHESSHESTAALVNISEGGALVAVDRPPPLHQVVWLRFEEPAATDWVKATVLRNDSPHHVGLSFADHCPSDFYMTAVLGLNMGGLFHRTTG